MCRFLMVKSSVPFRPLSLLEEFADVVRASKALNGDPQSDGWGLGWFDKAEGWRLRKSLRPIWEDKNVFAEIPETRLLLVHARSASTRESVGEIEHNQPFWAGPYVFVFNGFLQGVALPRLVPHGIGSQRIWHLLLEELERAAPSHSLRSVASFLQAHSRFVQALNIGLSDGSSLYAFSTFSGNPEYYTLHLHRSRSLKMISSEPLRCFRFDPLPTERVVEL